MNQNAAQNDLEFADVFGSDEDGIGSSEDDEDFVVPQEYIRITTVEEILARCPKKLSSQESEEIVYLDPSVVADHRYLGADMINITGQVILEEGSQHSIPAFIQSGIVVFPGQLLPLVFPAPHQVSVIQSVINGPLKIIALIPAIESSIVSNNLRLSDYGSTAEIIQFGSSSDQFPGCRVKALVRQRFKVLEASSHENNNYMAKVTILPETKLFQQHPWTAPRKTSALRRQHLVESAIYKKNWKNYQNYLNSPTTGMAGWILQQFDCHSLAARLRDRIVDMLAVDKTTTLVPSEPMELSYWAVNNLIVDVARRILLLKENNLVRRLKVSLDILEKKFSFVCISCNHRIAGHNDLALISSQGPNTIFGIPQVGQIRKVITVRKAQDVRVVSIPSVETSWFPGYAWSAGECIQCKNHIGWYIKALRTSGMIPPDFWVLCSESLKLEPCEEDRGMNGSSPASSRSQTESGFSSSGSN